MIIVMIIIMKRVKQGYIGYTNIGSLLRLT